MLNLKKYKQEQLLKYYDELNNDERIILEKDINTIDFDLINRIYKNSFYDEELDINKVSNLKIIYNINNEEKCIYKQLGEKIVKNNNYAVVLMAAGFGSRLGLNKPKGCLELNVNNKKISLFELFINQLKKVNNKLNCNIKLYIMTSTSNNKQITDFFNNNNFFDYGENNIKFFSQDNLPILDVDGKVVLKEKNKILFGPNGNGDVFHALKRNNLIKDMEENNIKYVLFSTIDNVLTNLVDTTFIGSTIKNGYELCTKTIMKNDENDKSWIFCKYDNHPFILPSKYINNNLTNKKDENGNYIYRETNITYHLVSINLIKLFSNKDMKYHRAYKNNKFLDKNGNYPTNKDSNSFKFEKFIFDAFEYAEDMLLYRTDNSEFCPIKRKEDIIKAENVLNKK